MKTAREIIAAWAWGYVDRNRWADDLIARLAAEGFSIVETGLVEQAFRDGVTYGTVCDVTDIDKAWETSAVRARPTREGKTE